MKIPKGLTEAEVLEVIEMVVSKISPKMICGFNEMEDVQQEGRIIAIQGLESYSDKYEGDKGPKKNLECFLRVHVNRRLKNLLRNLVGRREKSTDPDRIEKWERSNKIRYNLLCPADIEAVQDQFTDDNLIEHVHYNHLIEEILKKLPVTLRTDFLRMCDGVSISKMNRQRVREALGFIVQDGVEDEEKE